MNHGHRCNLRYVVSVVPSIDAQTVVLVCFLYRYPGTVQRMWVVTQVIN